MQKTTAGKQHLRDLVFGLLDCAPARMLILPLFGQQMDNSIRLVPLLSFQLQGSWLIKAAYFTAILPAMVWGISTLVMQSCHGRIWVKSRTAISMLLSVLIFIISPQPYAAFFAFILLMIRGVLL